MSMWNWFFDLSQESRLNKHDDKMKQLEERIEVLEGWIRYYEENKGTIDDV
jgi:CII-binding regulator of phage lambda lysogenization HflD